MAEGKIKFVFPTAGEPTSVPEVYNLSKRIRLSFVQGNATRKHCSKIIM